MEYIAIITPTQKDYIFILKEYFNVPRSDRKYVHVYDFDKVRGKVFKEYYLGHKALEIHNISELTKYLEHNGAKQQLF